MLDPEENLHEIKSFNVFNVDWLMFGYHFIVCVRIC